MSGPNQRLHDHHELAVDHRAAGEWIIGAPTGGRQLHVYRVAADDWLVSEVGQGNEGRGSDLALALAALAQAGHSRDWWRLVPDALDDASGS
jgi:hypothetical protein